MKSEVEKNQIATRARISPKLFKEWEAASGEGQILRDYVLLMLELQYTDNELRDVISQYIKGMRRN